MGTYPLVVLVGTTASGKSKLAVELAQKYNGEIICADSRTVYKYMDISTAKPTKHEQGIIKHHLLDVVEPNEHFSAARFKDLAVQAIDDIASRNKLPVLVGGTGLYVDGVIFDFAFLPPSSFEDRAYLQTLSIEELQQKVHSLNIKMPINNKNPRHLIRAIETNGAVPVKKSLRANTLVIGLDLEKEALKKRITKRIDDMVDNGLVEELDALFKKYTTDAPGLVAGRYKVFYDYLNNKVDMESAKRIFITSDFNLAKRQRSWFKRNKDIKWVNSSSQAEHLVKNFLK